MDGGGTHAGPLPGASDGGDFLLSLLNKRQHHPETPSRQSSAPPLPFPSTTLLPHQHHHRLLQQQQSVAPDPASAAVGPTVPFLPSWPSDGRDLRPFSRPQNLSPPSLPTGNHFPRSQEVNDLQRSGLLENSAVHSYSQHNPNTNAMRHGDHDLPHQRKEGAWVRQQHGRGNYRSMPPPGFSGIPSGEGNRESGSRTREIEHNAGKQKYYSRNIHRNVSHEVGLIGQIHHPGPPAGRTLQSFPGTDVEESLLDLHKEVVEDGNGGGNTSHVGDRELDDLSEKLVDSLVVEDVSDDKNGKNQH